MACGITQTDDFLSETGDLHALSMCHAARRTFVRPEEANRRYVVVISNQSPTSAVFHDVDVTVAGWKGTTHVVHMNILPPGKFFVEQGFKMGQPRWERIPLPVRPDDVLDPFTVASDRSIVQLEYNDGLGTRWRWTPRSGLTEVEHTSAQR